MSSNNSEVDKAAQALKEANAKILEATTTVSSLEAEIGVEQVKVEPLQRELAELMKIQEGYKNLEEVAEGVESAQALLHINDLVNRLINDEAISISNKTEVDDKTKVANLIKAKEEENAALLAIIESKNQELKAAVIAQRQAQEALDALQKQLTEEGDVVITPVENESMTPKPSELTEAAKAVLAKLEQASNSGKFIKFEKTAIDDGGFSYTTTGSVASFEGKINSDGSGSVRVMPDVWDNDIEKGNPAAKEMARHLVEDLEFAEVTLKNCGPRAIPAPNIVAIISELKKRNPDIQVTVMDVDHKEVSAQEFCDRYSVTSIEGKKASTDCVDNAVKNISNILASNAQIASNAEALGTASQAPNITVPDITKAIVKAAVNDPTVKSGSTIIDEQTLEEIIRKIPGDYDKANEVRNMIETNKTDIIRAVTQEVSKLAIEQNSTPKLA